MQSGGKGSGSHKRGNTRVGVFASVARTDSGVPRGNEVDKVETSAYGVADR